MSKSVTIAIIQASPVYLDLARSLEKMQTYIKEAAEKADKIKI